MGMPDKFIEPFLEGHIGNLRTPPAPHSCCFQDRKNGKREVVTLSRGISRFVAGDDRENGDMIRAGAAENVDAQSIETGIFKERVSAITRDQWVLGQVRLLA